MILTLEDIGLNDWFRDQLEADKLAAHELARVISVHKDRYNISNGQAEVFAELAGNLFYTADSPTDLPTTGDWVYADFYDDNTHAIIHGVVPRKTLLKRKAAGKLVDFQLIAANIDIALIIQSADYNFNLRRLERYLVMVSDSDITPVILLSKCDLVPQTEVDEMIESISTIAAQINVMPFSNFNADNIDTIKQSLVAGKTYCLLGSSGVGKTTLLNSILGSDEFETKSVSKKQNKGRHTTTSRELNYLENGAMLIDTPGMRELGNMSVDSGIDETFSEILALSKNCKFNNCSHSNEKGCAVLSAIASGEVSEQRYKNYRKMKNESAFNELSYHEKRKKDKDLGKMINSAVRNKQR